MREFADSMRESGENLVKSLFGITRGLTGSRLRRRNPTAIPEVRLERTCWASISRGFVEAGNKRAKGLASQIAGLRRAILELGLERQDV